jgi:hypothetical protein
MARWPALRFVALVALLGATACDCEAALRRLADRQAPPRQPITEANAGTSAVPASSDPAEQEPNDSPSQATPIAVTSELRPVRGQLSSQGDEDWFVLNGPAGGDPWLVELRVQPEDPTLELVLELEGRDQPPVRLTYPTRQGGRALDPPLVALGERGPLRVGVRAARGQGRYALRLVRRLTTAAIEAEPNDAHGAAWPLSVPGQLQGTLDRPNDRDVFCAASDAWAPDQLMTLSLTARLAAEATLELEAAGEAGGAEVVWATLIAPGQGVMVPNMRLPTGRWWLTLAGGEQAESAPYTLSLTPLKPPPSSPPQVLEAEPNDDPARPQLLAQPGRVAGWLHTAQDVDWLRLTLAPLPSLPTPTPSGKTPPAYLLNARLEPARPELALQLMLRGPQGGVPIVMSAAAGQPLELCALPATAGNYDVEVRALARYAGPSDARQDYALILTAAPPVAGTGELEPNDAAAQADVLALGEVREGVLSSPADRDYWALTLDDDMTQPIRRVRFGLEAHVLNLAFKVRDDEGQPVGVADAAGAQGAETLEVDLPPGRYTIEVSTSDAAGACAPYKLSASVIAQP